MSATASDFFEVSSIGDVTIVKLADAGQQICDATKEVELTELIRHIADPPPRLTSPSPSLATWERFRDDLFAFLDATKPKRIVLDFAGLDRIGRYHPIFSSAINSVYIAAKQRSAAFGCEWRLCGFTKEVREFFDSLSLARFFPCIHETQAEAVAAFTGAGKQLQ